jgi:glycosyltransferase involved in cell wall biosynthesis
MSDLTIVLPVWDLYVQYLGETLETLRAQMPVPHLVLVDNCSKTPIPTVAEAKLVRAPRRLPLGSARNLGLSQVDTEFVLFWDADDHMPPETAARLVAGMRADPDLSLLAARIFEGDSRPHHWPRRFTTRLARHRTLLALVHCVSGQVPTVGAVMRTETVRAAGGFPDAETGDDWALGVSLAFRGRVDVLDHVGRIYRRRDDSVWAGRNAAHLFLHARAVRRRVKADPEVPTMIKCLLPLVAAGQWIVIRLLRPLRLFVHGRAEDGELAASEDGTVAV